MELKIDTLRKTQPRMNADKHGLKPIEAVLS
ncbi:MAG: hypothetical protein QOH96_745 [Blastocatellia bacterium]|jgi:hypothetical protein|nr:hypothetical protein [Blastocatellia bacterium]